MISFNSNTKQVRTKTKRQISKNNYEIKETLFFILPFIDKNFSVTSRSLKYISDLDLHAYKILPLEKDDGKTILPNRTVAFNVFYKKTTKVFNNNGELLSETEKKEYSPDIYLVGTKFNTTNGVVTFLNSQSNKEYSIFEKPYQTLHFCDESTTKKCPSLLERIK